MHRLETENFQRGFGNIIAVLKAGADAPMAERVFAKLCDVRRIIADAPDAPHESERAVERQLETTLRDLPAAIAVAGVSTCFTKPIDAVQVDVISRVFSNAARQESWPAGDLSFSMRESLRAYLKGVIPHVLEQDDISGQLKANVASVLSSIGQAEDLADLATLVRADIERLRKVRAAQARGEGRRRSVMGHAPWYIRAIVGLDPANSEPILLDLLKEPEYERDVSAELARQIVPPPIRDGFVEKKNYEQIWSARARGRQVPYDPRRDRYAVAVTGRVQELLRERSESSEKRPLEFRLRVLAEALAKIDSHGSADLVYEVMSIPDRWNNHPRVEAFEALLYGGVVLPTELTLTLIDPCLEDWRKYGVQQNDQYFLAQYLRLLPFIADPTKGIERVRQLIRELRVFPHQFQGFLGAIGHSRSQAAWDFLLEIGSDKARVEQLGDAWINAVAAMNTPEARRLLLSFVDPSLDGLPVEITFSRDHSLVSRLTELARSDGAVRRRLFELCEIELPPSKSDLLVKIVTSFNDFDAIAAGLYLVNDTANPAVPYEIRRQLEDAFVERRPQGDSQNVFTLEPRSSNRIRTRLLEMAEHDARRKTSAAQLLAQIEGWRLQYGRPPGEPRHPDSGSGTSWPPPL